MDFQCDIYCYEAVDGYHIHVAERRRVLAEPLPALPPLPKNGQPDTAEKILEWLAVDDQRSEILDASPHERLALPYAGGSFTGLTAKAAYARLVELRELGYVVPDYALAFMAEEAGECLPESNLDNKGVSDE